jgi:hypothetical protein
VLGLIELKAGDPGQARELVEEALEIQLATGDLWSQGQCHAYLGIIADANASDHAQATAHFGQAVESLAAFRDAPSSR